MSQPVALVWLQTDLRLSDNPALDAAVSAGSIVIPVFVWSPEEEEAWTPGAASRWWRHQSLMRLDESLRALGSRLVIRRGPHAKALLDLATETGAAAVYWNRRYEPAAISYQREVQHSLQANGTQTYALPGNVLFEPGAVLNSSQKPFQVFTPFWKACLSLPRPDAPLPAPRAIPPPERWPHSLPIDALELEPRIDWASGIRSTWTPGEKGARAQASVFVPKIAARYTAARDFPGETGTSRLSPHLAFGEISPRQLFHLASAHPEFTRQVGWREFSCHLLFHFPQTPHQPLRQEFRTFPWKMDPAALRAWTQGRTGYPIVDAGMRELWHTGWMHNRVRMIVASFLVKHLLIPWQEGAAWFWDTLVDADLANNTMGWQWTAGCGADAAPYFRIFNPVLQGKKFDPQAAYVKRWVPELHRLPEEWIHEPWSAPPLQLLDAGLQLGKDYPHPIVEHAFARERALAALAAIKGAPETIA
jgi:deoxyribodipyrimidine photo-lyase